MPSLFRQTIHAQKILEIIGNPDSFISWMKAHHPNQKTEALFEGYQFALMCCINAIIDCICDDTLLNLESDYLFERCLSSSIPLNHITSNCEKATLLRNLKPHIKAVSKSNTYEELAISMSKLDLLFLQKIADLRKNHVSLSKTNAFSLEQVNHWATIDFLHTYLHQIKSIGPIANMWNPISTQAITRKELDHFLEGYCFTLQFCWFILLGEDLFSQTQLTKLHLADSWRNYQYNEPETDNNLFEAMNRTFNLDNQTCLDSFFYHIKNELTSPIAEKHGIHTYTAHSYFLLDSNAYDKNALFSDLLVQKTSLQSPNRTLEDKFYECLYWFPLIVVNGETILSNYGTASFNTLLAGTVVLHKPLESTLPKIIVAKFTHPHPTKKSKNSFSFGILIDGGSAAADHSYGWLIYHNLCWDYSGFAHSEYQTTMALIEQYKQEEKIDLRELTLTLTAFEKLIGHLMLQQSQANLYTQINELTISNKEFKSSLFEVLTAFICSRIYPGYEISINTANSAGEVDVRIENEQEIILIECKLNPNNCDVYKVIKKLESKVNSLKNTTKRRSMEFWFWERPSPENKNILDTTLSDGKTCVYQVVSDPNWEYARYVPKKVLNKKSD